MQPGLRQPYASSQPTLLSCCSSAQRNCFPTSAILTLSPSPCLAHALAAARLPVIVDLAVEYATDLKTKRIPAYTSPNRLCSP